MAIIKPEQLASGSYNITGSLFGTASTASYFSGSISNAVNAISASYALTASYSLNGGGSVDTGSLIITSSLDGNNINFTKGNGDSYPIDLSTITSATASYVENAQSASYYVETDPLFVSKSGSLATTGSNTFVGNQTILGDIVVRGTASVDVFHSIYNTSSIIYSSGSTKFGDTLDDTHEFTGSVYISGSLYAPTIVGSLSGTASYATTSSYVQNAQTASYYGGSVTSASYADTASYVTIAISSSFASSGIGLFSGSFSGSLSGDGSAITNLSFALGSVLFVSPSGSDADTTRAYHIGNIHKPFLTLQAARNAAISGDLIYILPNYFIFDNSGGVYDSNINDLNLWKNGVTYYWSPGCKLKFISCITNAASKMRLFRPSELTYETCTSVGYLEYEQYSYVPSNGQCQYFDYDGTITGVDYGFKFYSQTKSQIGYGSSLIGLARGNPTNTSIVIDVTLISDYESNTWVSGHSGGEFTYSLFGSSAADCPINFRSHVKERVNSNNSFLTIRNMWGPLSIVHFTGETLRQDKYLTPNRIIEPRVTSTLILNFDIKKVYYSTTHTSTVNACVIADNSNNTSLGTTINMNGDLLPCAPNSNPIPLFSLGFNTTINYNGNIYTNTTGNAGNIIATSNSSNSKIYINGDINYLGSSVTTNNAFRTSSGGMLKFNGNIFGNFANTIAQCGTGTIEINNSRIESSNSGSNSLILTNGGTTLGTIRINNSTITLSNSSSIGNGAYVKAIINNSTIINSSSVGSGITNAGSNGTLNILNSTIISPSSSINYPSGSTVVMANAVVNSPYIISNPVGDINIVTDIQF